jgi:hypothetical protein
MHQLSKHFNDIKHFTIEAYSEDEAKDFISRLDFGKNVKFAKDNIQHILDKLGWYLPFFIQILADNINSMIQIEGKQLSNETIDEAYNRLIKGIYFNTWDERLKEYDALQDDARKILKLCAFPQYGKTREELLTILSVNKTDIEKIENNLSRLLIMLKNDGYLAENDDRYIFRSPLLRDFWYDRFVK